MSVYLLFICLSQSQDRYSLRLSVKCSYACQNVLSVYWSVCHKVKARIDSQDDLTIPVADVEISHDDGEPGQGEQEVGEGVARHLEGGQGPGGTLIPVVSKPTSKQG